MMVRYFKYGTSVADTEACKLCASFNYILSHLLWLYVFYCAVIPLFIDDWDHGRNHYRDQGIIPLLQLLHIYFSVKFQTFLVDYIPELHPS